MIECRHTDEPELQPLLAALSDCENCDTAIILGSGLSGWAERFSVEYSLDYVDFPCLGQSIEGQRGRLLVVTVDQRRLLVFQGRLHLYQGLTAWQAALPIRLAHAMGCQRVLLTNAVGGIKQGVAPGDFMLIEDHLNLQGDNPLRGIQPSPFVDLCQLYEQNFYPSLAEFASCRQIRLHKGVLAALVGPCYETAAEIQALHHLGADVASMSMVPEAIMARYLDLDVAGLSVVTNYAAGRSPQALSHAEVLECAHQSQQPFAMLIDQLLSLWPG